MNTKETILLVTLLFALFFQVLAERKTEKIINNKDIQINRLAHFACKAITENKVRDICIKARIDWSNPK